jgi:hypothetical protein
MGISTMSVEKSVEKDVDFLWSKCGIRPKAKWTV